MTAAAAAVVAAALLLGIALATVTCEIEEVAESSDSSAVTAGRDLPAAAVDDDDDGVPFWDGLLEQDLRELVAWRMGVNVDDLPPYDRPRLAAMMTESRPRHRREPDLDTRDDDDRRRPMSSSLVRNVNLALVTALVTIWTALAFDSLPLTALASLVPVLVFHGARRFR